MPATSSPYSTPRHADVIAGAQCSRPERIAAAWASGHDLAAAKYGADAVPSYFGPQGGKALMEQLQGSPEDVTAAVLMEMVKKHLKVEDKDEDKAKPTEAPTDGVPPHAP